jgi:ribonucleotide reductase beta subunit family protein with ferritin-like domain
MAAEFHLAEYAFALHLPLQHLKGLVDIVDIIVTDENLHVAFLFDRADSS